MAPKRRGKANCASSHNWPLQHSPQWLHGAVKRGFGWSGIAGFFALLSYHVPGLGSNPSSSV
jgi:hypothetical protein